MKSKLYFLGVLLTGLILSASSCSKKDSSKTIVGKWQIDSVMLENSDQAMEKWRNYLVNEYQQQLQMFKDTLAKVQAVNPNDSINIMFLNSRIKDLDAAINRFSDINSFATDVNTSFAMLKGGIFEFDKDSTFIDPSGQQGKWYIKNDSLYFNINGQEEAVEIKELNKDVLKIAASVDIDKDFKLTVLYILTPVKETGKEEKEKK